MAEVFHRQKEDLGSHPDVPEMRARYNRILGGRDVALVDGPVFLVGLYCAISPWVVHFTSNQSQLMVHNVIIGIALGLLALGFTVTPGRMYGLSWAMCAIGVWLIISPWVAGSNPDAGVIANQASIGGLTVLLGLVCTMAAARAALKSRRART